MQELHVTKQDVQLWSAEWGNHCIFACGDNKSRGVAIMFNKYADKIQDVHWDISGRYIIVQLVTAG